MKASELIAALQSLMLSHGDLPVDLCLDNVQERANVIVYWQEGELFYITDSQ